MSATRLAVYMKEQILVALMTHAFKDREAEVSREQFALGKAVYADVFPADVLKLINKMPKDWITTDDAMRVKFGGDFTVVFFGEQLPVPASSSARATKVYLATDPMTDRFRDWMQSKKKLDTEKSEAKQQAKATLDAFTTVNALLKGWPEVEPFLKGIVKIPDRLPAVQADVLNATFKLPVAKKGKAK